MEEKQGEPYHFLGILENVTETITKLSLKYNFRITSISYEDLENILLPISGDGYQFSCVYDHLYDYFEKYGRHDKYIIITNIFPKEQSNNIVELVDSYLVPKINLMRLFKVGNIRLIWYCIHENIEAEDLGSVAAVGSEYESEIIYPQDTSLYSITRDDIKYLQLFIDENNETFKHDYINLAYNTYQKTYEINDPNISFLISMIGMEVLFNPGNSEITHRVSRDTAVILGSDRADSISVFKKMIKLYGIRSNIVHGDILKTLKSEDIEILRQYLSEAIKQTIKINKNHDEFYALLDELGFGHRPWIL